MHAAVCYCREKRGSREMQLVPLADAASDRSPKAVNRCDIPERPVGDTRTAAYWRSSDWWMSTRSKDGQMVAPLPSVMRLNRNGKKE